MGSSPTFGTVFFLAKIPFILPMHSPRPSSDGARVESAPALDVFALRDSVVDEYKRFATSFTTIHAPDISEQVEAIYAEDRYWPEPLIQINPSYKRSTDVGALVANGVLHPGCADIFRAEGQPLSLYKHQEQAVAVATEGESFVVTTGTGSETLERVTDSSATADSVGPDLGMAIDAGIPPDISDAALRSTRSRFGWRRGLASRSRMSTSAGSGRSR